MHAKSSPHHTHPTPYPLPTQVLPLVAQTLAHLEGLLNHAPVFAALCAEMETGLGLESGETGEEGKGGPWVSGLGGSWKCARVCVSPHVLGEDCKVHGACAREI